MERLYLTPEEIREISQEERESQKDLVEIKKVMKQLQKELAPTGQELPELTLETLELLRRTYLAGYERGYSVYSESLKEILC